MNLYRCEAANWCDGKNCMHKTAHVHVSACDERCWCYGAKEKVVCKEVNGSE